MLQLHICMTHNHKSLSLSLSRVVDMFAPTSSSSYFSIFFLPTILFICINPSESSIQSFIYGGCSHINYAPGTPYESNVNSILTSFVNSASSTSFNNFKISVPGSTQSDVVYGLFQCRGDLTTSDCRDCIAGAVSQLGSLCRDSTGGALQLEGCFVKYDNISFLGVEDKSFVLKKCGPSVSYASDELIRRDAVLGYLMAGGDYFRVGGSWDVQAVAQCTQDLSGGECQDCLSEAIGRVKSECGSSTWGDMFLGKCYTRYTEHGVHLKNNGELMFDYRIYIWWLIICGLALF
ncbi:plasmodesmata-located protein 6-like [Impatiens glandulifera]|uniref:plasmodesmata-located protein 6-like n=1 Tax=Impatiens glandulifera TaxID=253017 RepID=UPI001FB142D3|nr:plasmodesmata-located protein 6-like [Impatiens glandulifera]